MIRETDWRSVRVVDEKPFLLVRATGVKTRRQLNLLDVHLDALVEMVVLGIRIEEEDERGNR